MELLAGGLVIVLLLAVVPSQEAEIRTFHPLSDQFINHINNQNSTWRAGRNFPKDTPMRSIRILMGELDDSLDEDDMPVKHHPVNDLPELYDLRAEYDCPSISEIRDQGHCGSCWAVASVEAMTDRMCILSAEKVTFRYSSEDLLACCGYCGSCNGGRSSKAWKYWRHVGIVSGGAYNSSQGCKPYTLHPKRHDPTPECTRNCIDGYPYSYQSDLHKGSYYAVRGQDDMRAEIFKHGSIQTHLRVYEDFLHYKSGIYQHVTGKVVGSHAVKLIGWGFDESTNTPYWIAANSWGYKWGDYGFFLIIRGKEEYLLERKAHAGLPATE